MKDSHSKHYAISSILRLVAYTAMSCETIKEHSPRPYLNEADMGTCQGNRQFRHLSSSAAYESSLCLSINEKKVGITVNYDEAG